MPQTALQYRILQGTFPSGPPGRTLTGDFRTIASLPGAEFSFTGVNGNGLYSVRMNPIGRPFPQLPFFLATLCVASVVLSAHAASYYVDDRTGSDSASGTSPETAWKSLAMANRAALKPGDSLLFRGGGTWAGQLNLSASGAEGGPIVVTGFGQEGKPVFVNPDSGSASAINVSGSWIRLENVIVRKTFRTGINVGTKAEHNVFSGVEAEDCGLGMYIAGRYNRVTSGYFHDLHMIVNTRGQVNTPSGNDDYGAVGVVLANSDNEVSYSRFIRCIGPSFDYGVDGGAVEIWAERDVRNISIHHNHAYRCCGFFEIGGLGFAVEGVRVAYNEMADCFGLSFLLFNNAGDYAISLKDYRFENNTVVVHDCPGEKVWTCIAFMEPSDSGVFTMRNNLFYVASADRILDKVTSPVTGNNLVFHVGTAWFDPGFKASASDLMGKDPRLVDPGTCTEPGDYRLAAGSPAIDVGAGLGYASDLLGTSVPVGEGPDIGAYEADGTAAIRPVRGNGRELRGKGMIGPDAHPGPGASRIFRRGPEGPFLNTLGRRLP